MYTDFLRKRTSALQEITEWLCLGPSPGNEILDLWNDYTGNKIFGNRSNPLIYHIRVSEIGTLWHKAYKESMELLFVETCDTFGSEVVDALKSIAEGGPMPKITEDLELARKIAMVQVDYLILKTRLTPNDGIRMNEIVWTLEHLERVVENLQKLDLHTNDDETFIEQYGRFVCTLMRKPYTSEHRMAWLKNTSARMLDLARKFNKPLYWIFYGRLQIVVSCFADGRHRRLRAIDRCLKNIKKVSEILPDVKIIEGLMYYRKAAVMSSLKKPPADILVMWNMAEECMKTKGELLNEDLVWKSFLIQVTSVCTVPDHVKIKNLNLSGTIHRDINIHEVAMLAYHDEWWGDIYRSIVQHVRQATDFFQCSSALYKVLSKYPVRAAAMARSKDPAGRLIQTPATIKSTNR